MLSDVWLLKALVGRGYPYRLHRHSLNIINMNLIRIFEAELGSSRAIHKDALFSVTSEAIVF